MSDFIEVWRTGEIADGTMKMVKIENREILLARVGDNYYAADNRCPHMNGNLSAGKLEGTVVTCPVHHSQFDLTDGHVIRWTDWPGPISALASLVKSPRPLKTHEVRIEGDKVLISG